MLRSTSIARRLASLLPGLAAGMLTAQAQSRAGGKPVAPPAGRPQAYVYVEKLPQLPGGGGSAAIVAAIQERVLYPAEAMRDNVQGQVFVKFIVEVSGRVGRAEVVQGLRADCDSAVVWAVRHLPQFEPGLQKGKPVPVAFTIPVTFALPAPRPPRPGLVPR